ncbi:MAG TPA: hemerythrin domain-containing protein [Saprospiraceae bacterium]|nr:hemerythrin domain-containing protein [Saprospiraceae bacterium]
MPIKKSEFLIPLSREHHFGLLLVWKIKTGLRKGIESHRIMNYCKWYYENYLKPHFLFEELLVFPILGQSEQVRIALSEHKELTSLFETSSNFEKAVPQIASVLEKHIRFEERELFMEIEKNATADQLKLIQENHDNIVFQENTFDIFWEN